MKSIYILLISIYLLSSCSNREEKERALKEFENKQQELVNINSNLRSLDSLYISYLSELEVAKSNLERAKDFHLLRTESTRDADIRNATEYVISVEREITKIKNDIELLKITSITTTNKIDSLKEFLKN